MAPLLRSIRKALLLAVIISVLIGCRSQERESAASVPVQPTPVEIKSDPTPDAAAEVAELKRHTSSSDLSVPPVSINTQLVEDMPVSIDYPAVIDVEVSGFGLSDLHRYVTTGDEGDRLLLQVDDLTSKLVGSDDKDHPIDGVVVFQEVWSPFAYYLTNGTDGVYVSVDRSSNESVTISARIQEEDSDRQKDVLLVYDGPGNRPEAVLDAKSEERLVLDAGSEIHVWNSYLDDENKVDRRPGIMLTPDETGRLVLEMHPLPAEIYEIVHLLETDSGKAYFEKIEVETVEGSLSPDYRVHVLAEEGVQFNLPQSWESPIERDGQIRSADPERDVELTFTVHPDVGFNGAEDMSSLVFRGFGPVSLLYQDQTIVGEREAIRSVYSYQAEDGKHDGIFLTTVRNGFGYVVDLDSVGTSLDELQEIVDIIAGGWRFRSAKDNGQVGDWVRVDEGDVSFFRPANSIYEQLNNGWYRIMSQAGRSFLALRLEAQSQVPSVTLIDHFRKVAALGVEDFRWSEIYGYQFANTSSERLDFSYQGSDGQFVLGFIVAIPTDEGEIVIWAEALEEDYQSAFTNLFQLIISSINLNDS